MRNVIKEIRSLYYQKTFPMYVLEGPLKTIERFHPVGERNLYRELEGKHFGNIGGNNFGENSFEMRQLVKIALLKELNGNWWMSAPYRKLNSDFAKRLKTADYLCCILPGGLAFKFPELDAELIRRKIKALHTQIGAHHQGRVYLIPVGDMTKLPYDIEKQDYYLGDEDSRHALCPISKKHLPEFCLPKNPKWVAIK